MIDVIFMLNQLINLHIHPFIIFVRFRIYQCNNVQLGSLHILFSIVALLYESQIRFKGKDYFLCLTEFAYFYAFLYISN